MSKKSRRRNKLLATLALGLAGSALSKPDVSGAKKMKATEMNKRRVPAFIKERGVKGGNPLRPLLPKGKIQMPEDEFFGIDAFGPGMGAKKGKMIKAMGGAMVTRGQGQVMRTKKTKII
tara:strand:- start:3431 stop:3787 length:357 start_codon:yes stop_codon:yes gene_type:complete